MPRASKVCPICKKPAIKQYDPFCSKRCSDVDLGNWLGERYALPGSEAADKDVDTEES